MKKEKLQRNALTHNITLQQLGLTNNALQLHQISRHQFRLREFWAAVEYIMIFCNLVQRR